MIQDSVMKTSGSAGHFGNQPEKGKRQGIMRRSVDFLLLALLWAPVQVYGGQCLEGDCISGKGTVLFEDGGRYTGEFQDNLRHGYGEMNFSDGFVFKGTWRNDAPEGSGILFYQDGQTYKGDFVAGKRHGYGRIANTDGSIYEGEWAEDLPHGSGSILFADGVRYSGSWQVGVRVGRGTLAYPNGDVLEGIWQDGAFVPALVPGEAGSQGVASVAGVSPGEFHVFVGDPAGGRLRAGPGLEYKVLLTASHGYPLRVLEKKEQWWRVEDYQGRQGWIASSLLSRGPRVVVVTTANLRQGPGLDHSLAGKVFSGDLLEIVQNQGEWLQVRSASGVTAWVAGRLVWPPAEK